jgi:hypothetical protein
MEFPQRGKPFPAAERIMGSIHASGNDVERLKMPRKARDLASRAERIADAWSRFFPKKTFSGLTLEQFRETFKPCREVRWELAQLASQRRILLFRRRKHDSAGQPILLRVVHAVRADPEIGEDGAMYGAMGYVPRNRRRKPGRKKKTNASRVEKAAAGADGTRTRRVRKPAQ